MRGGSKMKKIFIKIGEAIAFLSLRAATVNVNSTCRHYFHQEEIPESAKRLRKLNDN